MNSKKIIIIAVAALLVIVIAVVAVVFVFSGKSNTPVPPKEEKVVDSGERFYFSTGELYCNIKESKSIVSISVVVVADTQEMVDEFTKATASVNDIVNGIVRTHTFEELQSEDGYDILKQEIFDQLVEKYETKHIIEISFEKFVIQP